MASFPISIQCSNFSSKDSGPSSGSAAHPPPRVEQGPHKVAALPSSDTPPQPVFVPSEEPPDQHLHLLSFSPWPEQKGK